jgi:copper homeostasis protein
MKKFPLLEICVETVDAALAAERGGADRIELCENLRVGGVTPSAQLMRQVRSEIRIPVFAMIRPRGGDFLYSDSEFGEMIRGIGGAKQLGMDGVVLGLLAADGRVDIERTRELVELAKPLPVTFHRAFDEAANLREALEDVVAAGAARILTSGGKRSAEEGAGKIAGLVDASCTRVKILPGGGITAANIERVLQASGAGEFHSGLSTVVPSPVSDLAAFEAEVRKMAETLRGTAAKWDRFGGSRSRERIRRMD